MVPPPAQITMNPNDKIVFEPNRAPQTLTISSEEPFWVVVMRSEPHPQISENTHGNVQRAEFEIQPTDQELSLTDQITVYVGFEADANATYESWPTRQVMPVEYRDESRELSMEAVSGGSSSSASSSSNDSIIPVNERNGHI